MWSKTVITTTLAMSSECNGHRFSPPNALSLSAHTESATSSSSPAQSSSSAGLSLLFYIRVQHHCNHLIEQLGTL